MRVDKLIEFLRTCPPDAVVQRAGTEYRGERHVVATVKYYKEPGFGQSPNSVLIE